MTADAAMRATRQQFGNVTLLREDRQFEAQHSSARIAVARRTTERTVVAAALVTARRPDPTARESDERVTRLGVEVLETSFLFYGRIVNYLYNRRGASEREAGGGCHAEEERCKQGRSDYAKHYSEATPISVSGSCSRTIIRSTCDPREPSAMRMPISRVRVDVVRGDTVDPDRCQRERRKDTQQGGPPSGPTILPTDVATL
jgi:hypothetical protein